MATNIVRNAGSGNWNDASKWDLNRQTQAGDIAYLNNAGTVTVQPGVSPTQRTSGLIVDNKNANLNINGVLEVGTAGLGGDINGYSFNVLAGSVTVGSTGALYAGKYVTSANGAIEVKDGGNYYWQGSNSTQTVTLAGGGANAFYFDSAFGGTIAGFNSGEQITYAGGVVNSVTIGTNKLTFNTNAGSFDIKLSTAGVTYDSSNLQIFGGSVWTTVPENPQPANEAVVTAVSSTTASGFYNAGDQIDITVTFDKNVTVTGTPQLTLETGATDRAINYLSGSGGNTLTFRYTVQAGDTSADLDTIANGLKLNGGTITSPGNKAANLALPAPGATGSLGVNKNIVIDTTAPVAPTVTLVSDTGSSDVDKITTNGAFNVAGENNATIEYFVNGAWTSAKPDTSAHGDHTVKARQTDQAGNVSTTTDFTFTVDKVAPTAPGLTLANDTGSSKNDGITKDASLNAPTGVEANATVQYSVNNGGWSAVAPNIAGDGDYSVKIKQIDLAGNESAETELTFKLDTTAPAAPTVTLVDDTGASGADLITSNGAFNVAGENNATIEYFVNGAWTTTKPDTSAHGDHTVQARQTDQAGNVSATKVFAFTVDKVAPTALGLTLANDTGSSKNDGITKDATLNAPTGVEANATVQYSVNNGGWSAAAPNISGDGDYSVKIKQIDLAGNESAETELTFKLDTTAPAAPTVALDDDTGASNADNITSNGAFSATGEAGAEIQFFDGAKWTTTPPDATAEGTHTVKAQAVDVAGNVSTATEITFTVDKTSPGALGLSLANDTGVAGDGVTNDATLNAPTNVELNSTVEYSTDKGATWSTVAPVIVGDGDYAVQVKQTDVAGNASSVTELTLTLDTAAPKPAISLTNTTLGFGHGGVATIVFDGDVSGFDIGDLAAVGATLGTFKALSATTYEVGYSSIAGFNGVGAIKILAGGFADVAGNIGLDSSSADIVINASVPAPGPGAPNPNPNPNNPTPNPTGDGEGFIPSLVVSSFVQGSVPDTFARLESLATFARAQLASYQERGVADPALGPYEALGVGFSDTSEFQDKYGALTESAFILEAYEDVFGRQATSAQANHFQAQIDYFEALYASVNIPEEKAEMMAKGAALGQMLGFAVLNESANQPYLAQAQAFIADAADGVVEMGKPLAFYELN